MVGDSLGTYLDNRHEGMIYLGHKRSKYTTYLAIRWAQVRADTPDDLPMM